MNTTGQQVFQYANPCRLPQAKGNNGYAVPNYFPQMPNNNPSIHFKKNNGLDPYTFLGYWRVRFPRDGFDNMGQIACGRFSNDFKNQKCSYAGLFYPQCYRTTNSVDNGLGWVAPYMWIPRNELPTFNCGGNRKSCTVGLNHWNRYRTNH